MGHKQAVSERFNYLRGRTLQLIFGKQRKRRNFACTTQMEYRKIIHIDMDAFFASVEQRERPELRGKPVAVGFDGPRGVLCTASYEARRFGVRSAMPVKKAKLLCPQLMIVPVRHSLYREISEQVHEIFGRYTDLIEPLSLDEAFLDITHNKKGIEMAVDIAKEIRQSIREELHLTASAGISYNKFLAKIASDFRKPDGLFVIHPDRALDFIARLPIHDFWGVGSKTAAVFHKMGVFDGAQLRACSRRHLTEVFGKAGAMYYEFARGIDQRPVVTERERKSVSCEQTFEEDIYSNSIVLIELYHTMEDLVRRLEKTGFEGHTLTLKIKYGDFSQVTRSMTTGKTLRSKADILPRAKQLLKSISWSVEKPIRLIGLAVSSPEHETGSREWQEGNLPFEFLEQ